VCSLPSWKEGSRREGELSFNSPALAGERRSQLLPEVALSRAEEAKIKQQRPRWPLGEDTPSAWRFRCRLCLCSLSHLAFLTPLLHRGGRLGHGTNSLCGTEGSASARVSAMRQCAMMTAINTPTLLDLCRAGGGVQLCARTSPSAVTEQRNGPPRGEIQDDCYM